MDLEHKTFKMEIEEVKDDAGEGEPDFKGVLSVSDLEDLQGDVVHQGAFTRTLKHHKGRFPMLIDHDHRSRIGILHAKEDGRKLKIGGFVNKEKQLGIDTLSDIKFTLKHKVPLGMSIGYDAIKPEFADGVRHLREIALWEGSVVTFPANLQARVTSSKSITSFADFPLADSARQWKAAAAEKRVRSWAGAEEAPNEKYRKAFVFCDTENPDVFDSYKLLIADVIDGKLTVVPRGIFAAAAVLQGARGGINIPATDKTKAKTHLTKYFAKMDLDAPFNASYNFDLDLWSVMDYLDHLQGTPDQMTGKMREVMQATASALNALSMPTDAEIDALTHSLYGEKSEAAGLSQEDEKGKAMLDDYAAFLQELKGDLQSA